jgi:hypothetical protein
VTNSDCYAVLYTYEGITGCDSFDWVKDLAPDMPSLEYTKAICCKLSERSLDGCILTCWPQWKVGMLLYGTVTVALVEGPISFEIIPGSELAAASVYPVGY